MEKRNVRVVHVEVDDKTWIDTEGLNRGLRGMAVATEDSYDFEDILNSAIQALYMAQPGGEDNYGGDQPLVGRVHLSRFNRKSPGEAKDRKSVV